MPIREKSPHQTGRGGQIFLGSVIDILAFQVLFKGNFEWKKIHGLPCPTPT